MKLIVITTPHFWEGEATAINELFRAGLEILHLRKPGSSYNELENLLEGIDEAYWPRLVTHEHFECTEKYPLKGIHLNGRNPHAPSGYLGHISSSCHSLEEVVEKKKHCTYVFLSPIYNSISKEGYEAAFTRAQLQEAANQGIIDAQVMALGGMNRAHLSEVQSIGFGGAVLLGDVWKHAGSDLIPYFKQLKENTL